MQQEKNSNYTRVVPACRYNLGYMRERREKYMRILAVWLYQSVLHMWQKKPTIRGDLTHPIILLWLI
jgi:hypothetical protein